MPPLNLKDLAPKVQEQVHTHLELDECECATAGVNMMIIGTGDVADNPELLIEGLIYYTNWALPDGYIASLANLSTTHFRESVTAPMVHGFVAMFTVGRANKSSQS